MSDVYDVVVIGGGSAGEVVAGRVADGGLSVAVAEKELVGGQCSYWACMPAKALLRPTGVLAEVRRVPGARAAVSGEADEEAVFRRRDELSSHWNDDKQVEWLDRKGIDLVRGHARISGIREVEVETEGGGVRELRAERAVVIATGSAPEIPDLGGSDLVTIWDNRDVTTADRVPVRMLVIGGGAVGVESAQAYARLGSDVTIVETDERLMWQEEPFVGEQLAERFEQDGIRVVTGAIVERFEDSDGGVHARLSNGDHVAAGGVVLSAVGRRPVTSDLGLDSIGLEAGGPVTVDDRLRSTEHPDWLFAVGDVNRHDHLTHMGKYEARVAGDQILGKGTQAAIGRSAVPRIVFTDPTIAAVGLTTAQAEEQGREVEVREASLGREAAAVVHGENVDGTVRVLVEDGRMVGATLTGPSAVAEMAMAFQLAILSGMRLDGLLEHAVPQFPTFSEVWLQLAEV